MKEVASREVKRTILRTTYSRTARAIDAVDGGEVGREHIFHEQVTQGLTIHCVHAHSFCHKFFLMYKL